MANLILTEIGWESRIRDKLGVDEAYLPDSVIGQFEVIGVAEANMISRYPAYEDVEGVQLGLFEAAVVCEAAALLCPTMKARLPAREESIYLTRHLEVDWDKRRLELQGERDGHLSAIDFDGKRPFFWVT